MPPKPTTSVERWNRAVHVAFDVSPDDLADEVLAKSDAEIVAELRAEGVDVDAFDAEGDALYAQLFGAHEAHQTEPSQSDLSERLPGAWVSEAPPPNVVPIGSRRRNTALFAVDAVAAAAAAGATYLGSQHEEEHKEKPAPVPSASAAPPVVKEAPSATPEEPKTAPKKRDDDSKTRR